MVNAVGLKLAYTTEHTNRSKQRESIIMTAAEIQTHDKVAQFLKTREVIKDVKDAGVWLTKCCSEKDLFTKCVERGILESAVPDWKLFMKALPTLKNNPYAKECYGEAPDQLLGVRDKLGGLVEPSCMADKEAREAKRVAFGAWALWQHPYNKNKMYLPLSSIATLCGRLNLDMEEVFKHLRKHPGGKAMYVNSDLSDAEAQVGAMLRKATVLGYIAKPSDKLDDTQNRVVDNVLSSPFSAVQGGAGAGKTTTVGHLIKTLLHAPDGPMVYCLTPTHKSRKCVIDKLAGYGVKEDEYQLLKISTIHSFVATFKQPPKDDETPLAVPRCFVLIDESSMIDTELLGELAHVLLTRNNAGYQMSFVGDKVQLPPVGRGEFYRQLVDTGLPCINFMNKCYRVDKPDLFAAYQSMREGKIPKSSENVTITLVDDDKQVNSVVGKLIHQLPDLESAQFITYQNKYSWVLNKWIQEALLKRGKVGPEVIKGFYKNDRVIYRGDNTQTLTNAMTGVVKSVGAKGMAVVWNDGKQTTVTGDGFKDVSLCACFTGHSSQGDEYDTVVVVCYDVPLMMKTLDLRFLYVAATRAKKRLHLIAPRDVEKFMAMPIKAPPLSGLQIPGMTSMTSMTSIPDTK